MSTTQARIPRFERIVRSLCVSKLLLYTVWVIYRERRRVIREHAKGNLEVQPDVDVLVKVPVKFRALALKLGGLMIKLGQFLSARADLLPEEALSVLASLMIIDVFQVVKPAGWELIQHLKAHPATASIPIILYTSGSLTPEQLHQSQHQGIPVVYKSFDLTELLHLIHSLTASSSSSLE